MSVKAALWDSLDGGRVRCRLCFRRCALEPGQKGFCGVRVNEAGELRTLVGDRIASVNLDPVEKKPLYHFLPSTRTLSIGTLGCNFACLFCQNSSISRRPAETGDCSGQRPVRPQDIVDSARTHGIPSISFTYNEPTVFFELMAKTADLALADGVRTVMVSNGCMSEDCLRELGPRITAANIDLKTFNAEVYRKVCSGSLDAVKRNLVAMKRLGWWVEVTTLAIPGLNDSDGEFKAIADFIAADLGRDTPWHVSAFFPCYRMQDRPPTPEATVLRACSIGEAEGLRYPYAGNLRSTRGSSTRCPGCGAVLIERRGFAVTRLVKGVCPSCGQRLAGVWT